MPWWAVILVALGSFIFGYKTGVKGSWDNLRWRARMHFYAQGMNHQAVDRHVEDIYTNPGLPDKRSYDRIREQRRAEGLEP